MHKNLLLLALFAFPVVSFAQGLQSLISGTLGLINSVVIPFLLGLGFLFFIINVIRYFVLGSTEEQGRENAKNLAIYSVSAFVIIVVFWGVVNLVASTIGLDCVSQPTADYIDPDSVRTFNAQPCDPGQSGTTTPSGTPNTPATTGGGTGAGGSSTGGSGSGGSTNTGGGSTNTGSGSSGSGSGASSGTNSSGNWFTDIFQVYPRQFRDYFWANWGSGSSGGSSSGGNQVTDVPVNCLLPNGTTIALLLSECEARGGQAVSPTTATQPNSYTLVDCVIFDSTTGQTRTVQVTQDDCDAYNSTGTNPSTPPSRPTTPFNPTPPNNSGSFTP